jgi:tubulin delta
MPVITVQLGQCGNQLGYSLFETLAAELDRQDYGVDGWETFFRPAAAAAGARDKACTARAVLIDMEPKVRRCCRAIARGWLRCCVQHRPQTHHPPRPGR